MLRERRDERRVTADGTRPREVDDARAGRVVFVEDVDLLQGLDVLAREGDGHDDDGAVTLGGDGGQRLLGRGAEPALRTDAALEAEARAITEGQPGRHGGHRRADVVEVRVAALDVRLGQAVGREQNRHGVAVLDRHRRGGGAHAITDGVEVAGRRRVALDARELEVGARALDGAVQRHEGRARRRARVLREQRHGHGAVDPELREPRHRLVGERVPAAHGDDAPRGEPAPRELLGHGRRLR